MEESSLRANVNFIKLNKEELSNKIALLVSENKAVMLWKKYPRHYDADISFFERRKDARNLLHLKTHNFYLTLKSEYISLSFKLGEISYFLKGKVIDQNLEAATLVVEIEDEGFRAEKRKSERLVTFPIYQVFAYFKYQKMAPSNVLFINKKDKEENSFLSQIDNLEKNKIQSLDNNFETAEDEDLIGFRVENISADGLSFFATQKEKAKIDESLNQNKFNLMINFEGKISSLNNPEIVYQVNYINTQLSNFPMYKVGVRFDLNKTLKEIIDQQSTQSFEIEDYQKEFEEFIRNE